MIIKMGETDVSNLLLSYSRSVSMKSIVGNAPITSLDISLDNDDGLFSYEIVKDAIFEVQPTDTSEKYFFKVYEMPETWDGIIELKLYDSIYLLDVPYVTKIEYPTMIQNQISEMSQMTGIIIDTSSLPTHILNKEVNQYDSTLTVRSYLRWIAEISGCNVMTANQYGKVKFEKIEQIAFTAYDDVINYKKGNPYEITKVSFNDGLRILEEPQENVENGNTYLLDIENPYISNTMDILTIANTLIGINLYSVNDLEVDYTDNLHLGHIVEYSNNFRMIVLSLTEKYVGGLKPDLILEGELSTENKEAIGQRITDKTRIRRLKVITDEIKNSLSIVAEHQESTDKKISEFELGLDGIKSSVESTTTEVKTIKDALGIEFHIESSLGYFFESESTDDTVLTARVLKEGEDIDPNGYFHYIWYCKHDGNSEEDILGEGKIINLTMSHFVNNALIYFTAEITQEYYYLTDELGNILTDELGYRFVI